MTDVIRKIIENGLPDLEIGKEYQLFELWDGEGDCPDAYNYNAYVVSGSIYNSYSYACGEFDVNYTYEIIEQKECSVYTVIKLVRIEII